MKKKRVDSIKWDMIGSALLLAAFFGILLWKVGPPSFGPETLEAQQARLDPELWRLQNKFDLTNLYVTLNVKHPAELLCGGHPGDCWGETDVETGQIDLISIYDMPAAIPMSARAGFQKKVLEHEVMHLKLTSLGVPSDVQDRLIRGLQPAMDGK
jgi:hypothetical protein